jgi:hypothetical protein
LRIKVQLAVLCAALLALNVSPAFAQIIQNFEDNPQKDPLLYEQCWVGEAVRVDSQGVIQGGQQLSAGPLNKNKVSYYRTPFLSVTTGATFSFKHMAEDAGNQGLPRMFVDLLDGTDTVVATLYSIQYVAVRQVIPTTVTFDRSGVYRVQWRFTGENGNDRVALDEVLLNATNSSQAYPTCGAVVPVNQPPVAAPDTATSPHGAAVVVNVIANDADPDGMVNPATVDPGRRRPRRDHHRRRLPRRRIVEVDSFYTDGEAYRGGIYVACGDLTGDGRAEVISGTGTIGPATVRVWEVGLFTFTQIASWTVSSTPEARVAACDVTGDATADILVTGGPGRPATLGAYTGMGAPLGALPVLGGFQGGAFVACGSMVPSRPGPQIVVSADAGGAPLLEIYDTTGARLAAVLADDGAAQGGVRVAVGDVDPAVPGAELIVGSGVGRPPLVRLGTAGLGPLAELRSFVVPNVP